MLVRDYMTANVFTVRLNEDLVVSQGILEWQRVRQIPVVNDDESLVGLIRHRDLLKAALTVEHVLRAAREAQSARGRFSLVLSGGSTPRAAYRRLALHPATDTTTSTHSMPLMRSSLRSSGPARPSRPINPCTSAPCGEQVESRPGTARPLRSG